MKEFMVIAKDNLMSSKFLNEQDRNEFIKNFSIWTEDLIQKKLFVRSDQLSNVIKRIESGNGSPQVIDGPFAETKEILSGYFLIRAEDIVHATNIASTCPVLRFDHLEIYEIIRGTHND